MTWLASSPWPTTTIQRLFDVRGGTTPPSDDGNWGGDIDWATPVDLRPVHGGHLNATGRTLSTAGLAASGLRPAPPQSIVLSCRAPIGYVAITERPMTTNQGCKTLLPREELDVRFVRYQLEAFRPALEARGRGATFVEVSSQTVAEFPITAPPLEMQRRVADMLDTETARIDTLIAKSHRTVELLSMRDVRFLDAAINRCTHVDQHGWAAPESWARVPLRSLTDTLFSDGDWVELPHITDDGVRLIQTGNIGVGRFKEQGFRYISDDSFHELKCTEVLPGDVLICRLAEPVGRACVAPDLGSRMITSVDVTIVRPRLDVVPDYVALLLSTPRWLQRVSAQSQGGTRDRIARLKLGEMRAPLPGPDTQRAVVAEWNRVREDHDRLRASIARQQSLLQNRRRALITAAVTGQIEV